MDGVEMRELRSLMGWSQQDLADHLDRHRLTIVQDERGYRLKGGTPVVIPKVVDLACVALVAGLSTYSEVFYLVDEGEDNCGGRETLAKTLLPEGKVDAALRQTAINNLRRRKVIADFDHSFFFLWSDLRPLLAQIKQWLSSHDVSHILGTTLNRDMPGEGIAVLDIPDRDQRLEFKMRWIGGV